MIAMTVSALSLDRSAAKTDRCPRSAVDRENARVPKRRTVAVVVAIHLHRLVGRRRRIGRRPTGGQVQSFAAEDAEDVGLRRGAVDVTFRAPVVFGDADLRARIV